MGHRSVGQYHRYYFTVEAKNTRPIASVKTPLVRRLNCLGKRRMLITKISRQKMNFPFSASNDEEKWELVFGSRSPAKHSFQFGWFPFLFFKAEIPWALDFASTKPLAADRQDRRRVCRDGDDTCGWRSKGEQRGRQAALVKSRLKDGTTASRRTCQTLW